MKQSSKGSLRLAFGGFLAMAAAMGIGRFVYTPILPAMIEALDWSKVDAGLVASANFFGYLIGALVVGRRTFVTHPRHWLFVGLAVSAVTTGAMALSSDIHLLMAIRFASGIGSAFMIICASALVLERLSAAGDGQFAFVHFAGVGAGIAISATIVTTLTAFAASWQVMWLASGLVAALLSLMVVSLVVPGASTEDTERSIRDSRGLPGLSSLSVAHGFFGFGYVITATFLVTQVRETVTVRDLEPWIWVIVGCATIPSVPLWQWLGRRTGLLNAYAFACLAEAVGVVISIEWVNPIGICFSAILFGGTFMGLTALGVMAARELSSGGAQWAIGLTTASFGLGQMIGPTVAGILSDQTGSLRSASFLATGALILAATLVLRASFTSPDAVVE